MDAVLAYLDAGGAGPTIVLVHGGGDNAGTWHELLPPLAEMGRVVAPDLAGHGQSDDPSFTDGPPDLHTEVHHLLDALGVTDPVLLVGHSLGAPVVLALARLRATRAILLLDGAPHRGIFEPAAEFDADAYEARMRRVGFGAVLTQAEVDARANADPHAETVRRGCVPIGEGRYQVRPSVATTVLLAAAGSRADNPYRDLRLYGDVDVPTIVVQATHGNGADVREDIDALLRPNPLVEVRWLDSSHSVHWDHPDVVIDAVRELLTR